jgi:hypothetical protein
MLFMLSVRFSDRMLAELVWLIEMGDYRPRAKA